MTHYIYKVTNVVNGKFYIGYTNNWKRRWIDHKRSAVAGEKSRFYNAVRKYGKDQFTFEVIEEVPSAQAAKDREIRLIAELSPEYNVTTGGEGGVCNPCPQLSLKKSIAIRNSPKNEGRLERAWVTRRASTTTEEFSAICAQAQSALTVEQRAQKSRKLVEASAARTAEEEAERQRKRAETVANWTPEQKAAYGQKLTHHNLTRVLTEEAQQKIAEGQVTGGHLTGQLMKSRLEQMSPEEYEARNRNIGDKVRQGRQNESEEKKAERERKRLASYLATRAANKAKKQAEASAQEILP
jgi:group I intron endonuclease